MRRRRRSDVICRHSSPLPPRSGGEGSGVGGLSARNAGSEFAELPPTPAPSPPRGSRRAEGGEIAARSLRPSVISTGRGVQRSQGLHTLYISPLKALAVD